MQPYNDTDSRQTALNILSKFNPALKSAKSVIDIECDNFYVDVKKTKHNHKKYDYVGINKTSFDKYITFDDKPVYILFIFNDNYYTMIDIKSKYRVWSGYTIDEARGKVFKTIYNYPLNNKKFKKYEQS
jgi:hypothetical protein